MGHSAKKKTVTRKFDLLHTNNGFYEIAILNTMETRRKENLHTLFFDKNYLYAFCEESFEKRTSVKLRKGEVAEMIVTITRK